MFPMLATAAFLLTALLGVTIPGRILQSPTVGHPRTLDYQSKLPPPYVKNTWPPHVHGSRGQQPYRNVTTRIVPSFEQETTTLVTTTSDHAPAVQNISLMGPSDGRPNSTSKITWLFAPSVVVVVVVDDDSDVGNLTTVANDSPVEKVQNELNMLKTICIAATAVFGATTAALTVLTGAGHLVRALIELKRMISALRRWIKGRKEIEEDTANVGMV